MSESVAKRTKKTEPAVATEVRAAEDVLTLFHPVTAGWFRAVFEQVTAPQREGWPAIARGESTLILAPTGTGKTLTAFLWCLDRLMLQDRGAAAGTEEQERGTTTGTSKKKKSAGTGCKVLYISPLKALAVDVERNLRSPLAGIANMAQREGVAVHVPDISVRTGDTSPRDRARFRTHPGDILITTPESLYLLLTSNASEALRSIETVIIDEIHALVPTKRGAHLMLSIERLEALCGRKLQRIGLSATQRPLEEVARFLGGADTGDGAAIAVESPTLQPAADGDHDAQPAETESNTGIRYRPVTIINAGARKILELTVEVPVEDMARLGDIEELPSGPASQGPKRTSIWQSIHPRLLEIVRERTSTLIFVNARRVAERLAGALNELAGENLARAHHGSLAAAQRSEIEEMLKAGRLKALVCTSSLELGIDMGAVDLVVQIEAPPSVASGMQRIGRAGHQVGAPSTGIIFPKYRADLVACAAVTQAMHEGHVESTRFLRNPLDVLAQQVVAILAQPPSLRPEERKPSGKRVLAASGEDAVEEDSPGISYDALLRLVRSAAPFAGLSMRSFDGVLDMLAGRYPSDEFAELRPRIIWDRQRNWLTPRQGAKRLAILNGGTIPDRGLYGVFLSGASKPLRVGELDEEMVFEARTGETFMLGASTWRIDEITHDRVLVSPAPGEPGKMPFWHGDRPGRPVEFGRRIGALTRELRELPRSAAMTRLMQQHDLGQQAAENVLRYLADQELATTMVPDDRTIVIERVRDELGDWRLCCLTPFGSRVHTPWAMAVSARLKDAGLDVETMWSEDGFVIRFPETEAPPDADLLLMSAEEANELILRQLGSSALFAAKFREASSRALLLPRRRADGRSPLWQQRKRAYDLLSVASRYREFPMLLEAYRECLRDVFDMPALMELLRAITNRSMRVHVVDSRTPSPFAGALLFSYVANYIYDGDAPLAERRAQALAIDQDQLRELLGDADLRELLDAAAIEETEEQLQCVAEGYQARSLDGVHDLLLRLGDLTREEIAARTDGDAAAWIERLLKARRVLEVRIAGEKRVIAMEDAARVRDALGVPLPPGLPAAFLEPAPEALLDIVRRFARTHGPFTTVEVAERYALPKSQLEAVLERLVGMGRVVEGGFRPGGLNREWLESEVLRTIRRKSLAKLRKQVEPVAQQTLARLFTRWHGVVSPRRGLDALLDVIEGLQGAPLAASLLESEILPARVLGYKSADLDTLVAAGEVVWVGLEPTGEYDGRIALYLADRMRMLWPPNRVRVPGAKTQGNEEVLGDRELQILGYLRERGASFFQSLHDGVGGGYPGETLDALWSLVWRGFVINDAVHALREYCERASARSSRKAQPARRVHHQQAFRSRRTTPPTAQGRWSLNAAALDEEASTPQRVTAWSAAMAQQLLQRYGVVFRETAHAESLPGGFSAIYDALKTLEESGRVRRGYFAADLSATQFAMPGAVDLLRALRPGALHTDVEKREVVMLAASDPANPYGTLLRWPAPPEEGSSLTRSVGARVVLIDGALTAYMRRGNPNIQLLLPEEEPQRSQYARALAEFLVAQVQREDNPEGRGRTSMLIASINGVPVAEHPLARVLLDAGFRAAPMGFNVRRGLAIAPSGSLPGGTPNA
ncbi:ATP dependent helicase, Lhr family [Bryocella elongata]|uniref:ATP dependent helicase, Lhr family n=1 Tax=Bryocella elongata TaxID=863522 RepID=A0A1H6B1Y8_9BACT|nr:DEAD/DEAH box helicase [Bryocella elongata]SEG54881.1 ATP dependent helicase, Lhr family [Bryocella elongata]